MMVLYRNRSSHLAHFLGVMHPFLQRQNIQYTIVVVNQTGSQCNLLAPKQRNVVALFYKTTSIFESAVAS
jgi:hypothetical protein